MSVLGIGTDIIECLRIAKMIERHGELFLTRVYTPHEIEYCTARKASTQHYAGRFAAKEAVRKALGSSFPFREIEIARKNSGEPYALHKKKKLPVSISISHDAGIAIAVAAANKGSSRKN